MKLKCPLCVYYVLYESFVAYARYPEEECGTLDIRDGTYIVEI